MPPLFITSPQKLKIVPFRFPSNGEQYFQAKSRPNVPLPPPPSPPPPLPPPPLPLPLPLAIVNLLKIYYFITIE